MNSRANQQQKREELWDGDFEAGFLSAITGRAMRIVSAPFNINTATGLLSSAVIGGTVSEIGGGKFANGALTSFFVFLFGRAAIQNTQTTAEDEIAHGYSENAYQDDGVGFADLGIDYAPKDGFSASLYLNDNGIYYLTFRGTEMKTFSAALQDWGANISQAFGFKTSQYEQATSLAHAVFNKTHGNVVFVGHSLGGGLASAAAYATGGRAITFNASGLSYRYRTNRAPSIRAHYVRGDILSLLQDFSPLPDTAGVRINGRANHWYLLPLNRHAISNHY